MSARLYLLPLKKYILLHVYANEGVQNEPRGSRCLLNSRFRIPKDAAALDVGKISLYQNLPWFSKLIETRTVGPLEHWAQQASVSLSGTEEAPLPTPWGTRSPCGWPGPWAAGLVSMSLKQRTVAREMDS